MGMGSSFEEQMPEKLLQVVFHRFRAANLNLNAEKCALFPKKKEFLGHTVSVDRIHISEETSKVIRDLPRPPYKHEVMSKEQRWPIQYANIQNLR